MSEKFQHTLAYHCAPALLGIKASNLINLNLGKYNTLFTDLKELNTKYKRHFSYSIIKKSNSSILIMVYKPLKLKKYLFDKNNYNYLLQNGYPKMKSLKRYINCLKNRINVCKEFPHEIGIFLGYDLNDVIDFTEGIKPCLFNGVWKVFSNCEEKKKLFIRYSECRNLVIKHLENGKNLKNIL